MSDTTSEITAKPVEGEIAPPPPVETVTLTIDGAEVTVDKGTNIIEAARKIGKKIAAFCYHPGLEVVAVCRQCLVTVEGAPKLTPACQGIAGEGMVVHTTDEASTDARRQLLEFTLLNHPVDCPICDKAGECTLQEQYFDNNAKMSRLDVPKVRKPKVVDLGPTIVLDAERCILCTRCIRVCDDVAGEHQLEISQRGDHSQLGTAPGQELDNPYSLNTVDVCPVGALTSKDFRFSMRAWELMSTPSVCNGCSTGCNIEIHHKGGKTYRLIPRHNDEVNGHWMCDDGRISYHALTEKRLVGPVVDGMPSNWKRALDKAADKIGPLLKDDPSSLAIVFSPHRTNEENYILAKLAKAWKIERRYLGGNAPDSSRADEILRKSDVTPNRRGVKEILGEQSCLTLDALAEDMASGAVKGLVVLGHEMPLSDELLTAAGDLECLVVLCDHELGLAKKADVCLPIAGWTENTGSITNFKGRVQRMQAAYETVGQAKQGWQALSELAGSCGQTMKYETAEKVFSEMKGAVPAFADAKWGRDVPAFQLRFANSRG
ncbi:MAG: (2Fe-2S)-binding protein [Kofleriaceae bacterium]|nr:(2Fe-2S)-binding protein [Kofleriaceae bacterium]